MSDSVASGWSKTRVNAFFWAVVAGTSACSVEDVSLAGRACSPEHLCVSGYSCLAGVCVADPAADAGRPDAGQDDAGRQDAGAADSGDVDAGAFDAGTVPDSGSP